MFPFSSTPLLLKFPLNSGKSHTSGIPEIPPLNSGTSTIGGAMMFPSSSTPLVLKSPLNSRNSGCTSGVPFLVASVEVVVSLL